MNIESTLNPLQFALFQAAKVGNIKLMSEFIKIGANPYISDEFNLTAIDYAKLACPIETAELLFEYTEVINV